MRDFFIYEFSNFLQSPAAAFLSTTSIKTPSDRDKKKLHRGFSSSSSSPLLMLMASHHPKSLPSLVVVTKLAS